MKHGLEICIAIGIGIVVVSTLVIYYGLFFIALTELSGEFITKDDAYKILRSSYPHGITYYNSSFVFLKSNSTRYGDNLFIEYYADPNSKTISSQGSSYYVNLYNMSKKPIDRFAWDIQYHDSPVDVDHYLIDAKTGEYIGYIPCRICV